MPLLLAIWLGCGGEESLDSAEPCPLWYSDLDADGFGDPDKEVESCVAVLGLVDNALDCDDGDGARHPGAQDLPLDGVDQDCDWVDPCLEAERVESVGSSCPEGVFYVVTGNVAGPPAGDCVCEVLGNLTVDGPEGTGNLHNVQRMVRVITDEPVEFPALKQADVVKVSKDGAVVSMPRLETVGELELTGAVELRVPALRSGFTLSLIDTGVGPVFSERLESIEGLWVSSIAPIESLVLPEGLDVEVVGLERQDLALDLSGLRFQRLDLIEPVGSGMVVPSSVRELSVYASHSVELTGPEHLELLYVWAPEVEIRGLLAVQDLDWYGSREGTLSVPDLVHLQRVDTEGRLSLSAPELVSVTEATLDRPADLPKLRSAQQLVLLGQTLPALEEVDELTCEDAELPALRRVGELDCDGSSLPALTRVDGHVRAHCSMPALAQAGSAKLEGCERCYDSLRYVGGDLSVSGEAEFPELLRVEGELGLYRTDFNAPSLAHAESVVIGSGSIWSTLPVSATASLDHTDGQPWTWVDFAQGLTLTGAHVKPQLTIQHVGGNVHLDTHWTDFEGFVLQAVDGDLSYCFRKADPAVAQAWLDTVQVGGQVSSFCE